MLFCILFVQLTDPCSTSFLSLLARKTCSLIIDMLVRMNFTAVTVVWAHRKDHPVQSFLLNVNLKVSVCAALQVLVIRTIVVLGTIQGTPSLTVAPIAILIKSVTAKASEAQAVAACRIAGLKLILLHAPRDYTAVPVRSGQQATETT